MHHLALDPASDSTPATDLSRALAFDRHRPRLTALAHRMLGSRAEAEDLVQDAWLRWHSAAPHADLRSEEAWLVTVVTRMAIDRLRVLRTERTHYPGFWLPEPMVEPLAASPEDALERAHDVSSALMLVLERLAPEERAAFLLREVFDADYADVAAALGKSEAACRQLVHRARERVQAERPRFAPAPQAHAALVQRFAAAARSGDLQQLRSLLAADALLVSDGGGKVPSFTRMLEGAERLARLYFAFARWHAGATTVHPVRVDGAAGLLRFVDGRLESVQSIVSDGAQVQQIHTLRNPDKLARIALLHGLF